MVRGRVVLFGTVVLCIHHPTMLLYLEHFELYLSLDPVTEIASYTLWDIPSKLLVNSRVSTCERNK